jgi:hypothetical protein
MVLSTKHSVCTHWLLLAPNESPLPRECSLGRPESREMLLSKYHYTLLTMVCSRIPVTRARSSARGNSYLRDGQQARSSSEISQCSSHSMVVGEVVSVYSAISWPTGDIGPYVCAGKLLALMEIRLVVAEVVRRYDLTLAPFRQSRNSGHIKKITTLLPLLHFCCSSHDDKIIFDCPNSNLDEAFTKEQNWMLTLGCSGTKIEISWTRVSYNLMFFFFLFGKASIRRHQSPRQNPFAQSRPFRFSKHEERSK